MRPMQHAYAGISVELPSSLEELEGVECPNKRWFRMVEQIDGTSMAEKLHNARTTLEMLAVSKVRLYEAEQDLCSAAKAVVRKLDSETMSRFIDAQTAWRKYIVAQSRFAGTDTSGGGSAQGLHFYSSMIDEVVSRTEKYEHILGK